MIAIGITGGIGCGKSTVCKYIEESYDTAVFMADNVGHEVMAKGGCAYDALLELLGEEYLLPDGNFDRKKIGTRAFKEPKLLEKMNEIIHPAVHKTIEERVLKAEADKKDIVLIEAAILIETGYRDLCDEYWYVFSNREVRFERLLASRDIDKDKIESIIDKQLSEEEFTKNCEFIVNNSYDFEDTKKQVDERIAYLHDKKGDNK